MTCHVTWISICCTFVTVVFWRELTSWTQIRLDESRRTSNTATVKNKSLILYSCPAAIDCIKIRADDDESAALSQSHILERLLKMANEVSLLISFVSGGVGVSTHRFCCTSLHTLRPSVVLLFSLQASLPASNLNPLFLIVLASFYHNFFQYLQNQEQIVKVKGWWVYLL